MVHLESRYSIEQTNNATEYSTPSLVKDYARKAQFGQIFTFDKKTAAADGVFRTSFTCSFCIHLRHAGRALFKDIWSGLCVTIESLYHVEYGRNEKLGDNTTKTSTYL